MLKVFLRCGPETDSGVGAISHDPFAGPDRLPARAAREWNGLAIATTTAAAPGFDPDRVGHLPRPVARWLRHAIEPGTPPFLAVGIEMHGSIRIGRWRPFTARQVVGPSGYLWAADAGRFPFAIRGFDRFSQGSGEMRWLLDGLIPVVTAAGADVTRSAAGRHASELIGLIPGGALAPGVTWREIDDRRATATVTAGGFTHQVTIDVDQHGSLRSLVLPRWGDPDKGPFALHPFGVAFEGERSAGGYVIPAEVRAGWWFGTDRWTDGEFFRCTIDRAAFR